MENYIACECKGTGFIPVVDLGGDGVEYGACPQHNPEYAPSIESLLARVGLTTGITSEFFNS